MCAGAGGAFWEAKMTPNYQSLATSRKFGAPVAKLDSIGMVATSPDWRGWLALAVFALQNGTDAIFGQFVLQASSRAPISARTYALVSETCFKLPTALLLYAIESGGPCEATRRLLETSRRRPQQWAQISVPALLYTFGAVLQVVGAANLDAPVVKLLFQAKIPLTAACAVYFLGRRLSRGQWIALAVLVSGVVLVGSSSRPATNASNHEWERVPHHHAHEHHRPQHEQGSTHAEQGRQLLNQQAMRARSEPLGISTLLVAALCSAFASVYLEKQLKQHVAGEEGPPSLWLRNIQLSSVSALTAAGMVVAHYDAADAADGIMRGWDWLVWVYAACAPLPPPHHRTPSVTAYSATVSDCTLHGSWCARVQPHRFSLCSLHCVCVCVCCMWHVLHVAFACAGMWHGARLAASWSAWSSSMQTPFSAALARPARR